MSYQDRSGIEQQRVRRTPNHDNNDSDNPLAVIAGGHLPLLQEPSKRRAQAALIEAAVRILIRVNKQLGFTYFTYVAAQIPGQRRPSTAFPFFLSNYPERWIERYQAKSYLRVDPVYLKGVTNLEPFIWGDKELLASINYEQRQFIDEARDHRIFCGVTVPIHGPGAEVGLLTAAHDRPDVTLTDSAGSVFRELDCIARQTHALVSKRILVRNAPVRRPLTHKERRCLEFTAWGKTSWEIANIIERSEATVNFHLKNAVNKLNACNKCHAVARAIIHGLIDP